MTNTFITHCETTYRAMEDRATIQRSSSTDEEALVFTGRIGEVFKSLNISQTYYGPIFQTLEDVGAILRAQRGGRDVDTIIILKGLPEIWPEGLGWKGRNSRPLTEDSRYGRLLLDVQELQESIGGLNVVMALSELVARIDALEKQDRNRRTK
jgi:hypothetical protein